MPKALIIAALFLALMLILFIIYISCIIAGQEDRALKRMSEKVSKVDTRKEQSKATK